MFRNYFVRFAKNSGLIKFLGVPLNQTLKKPCTYKYLGINNMQIYFSLLLLTSNVPLQIVKRTPIWGDSALRS